MKAVTYGIAAFAGGMFMCWYGGMDWTVRSVDNAGALVICLMVGLFGYLFGEDL